MQHYDVSDQELIRLYLGGNPASFEKLLKRYKSRLFASIFYLVRDKEKAEDVFQETFIKIISTLNNGGYKEEGKFLPWAIRIARNIIIDNARVNCRMPMMRDKKENGIMSTIRMKDDNVETKMIRNQTITQIRMLIEELPHEQREIIVLRHYADLSFKEIAELTNVNINTALGRMRYALRNLRKLVKKKKYSAVF